jgi:hypothetical protein
MRLLLLLVLVSLGFTTPSRAALKAEPSIAYDTLCLLGLLSGDPFYVRFYPAERERWWNALPDDAQRAAERIVATFKKDNGITSASLTLWYSTVDPTTLDDLIAAASAPDRITDAMRPLQWWDTDAARQIEETAPDVAAVLRALKAAGFAEWWEATLRPQLAARAAEIEAAAKSFDPSAMLALTLGHKLAHPDITVEVLYFVKPHGISMTGQRYLTGAAYPIPITIRTALHESMHPPFDSKDPRLWQALASLRQDPVLMPRIEHHNKSYGYNTFEGFVEEDCVKALEHTMAERLGLGVDIAEMWRANDDGMHVLAPVVYRLLHETKFLDGTESFQTWLIRMLDTGRIKVGAIQPIEGSAWKPTD